MLTGVDRPRTLNPYEQFRALQPAAVIDQGVYVYDGTFSLPLAASLEHAEVPHSLLKLKRPAEASEETQLAAHLAPDSVAAQSVLRDALAELHRMPEARAAYTSALQAPETLLLRELPTYKNLSNRSKCNKVKGRLSQVDANGRYLHVDDPPIKNYHHNIREHQAADHLIADCRY